MKTQLNQGLHEVIDLLLDDGVLLAPTDMGYVLAACTNKAIHTIYDIKRRPVSKPSGIVVSPELLKKYSIGKSKNIGKLLPHPMGIIDYYDPQNAILNCATSRIKSNGKVAFFIYLNELLTDLAEKSYEAGYPLMATSANLAGMGNVYNLDNMPQEILERAQLVQGGDTSLYQTRSDFENITNTIMDVATGELVRSGVFVNQILHHLNGMGILKDPASKVIDIENEIPRSFLFLLAFKEKTFEQIQLYQNADVLVLDLQDSCPLSMKQKARQHIESFIHENKNCDTPVFIRLNEMACEEELIKDLNIRFNEKVVGFILPMLSSRKDLDYFVEKVANIERREQLPKNHFKLIPLIECSAGMVHINEILGGSERNFAAILGHADFFADTGMECTTENLNSIRRLFLTAARANHLIAIDTPFTRVQDINGLIEDVRHARQIGFESKVILHPNQVKIVNQIFGIEPQTHDELKEVISHYENSQQGIFVYNDQLFAPPFIKKMKRELKRKVFCTLPIDENTFEITQIKPAKSDLELYIGKVIEAKYPRYIDSGWINIWKSLTLNNKRINNDLQFVKAVGYEGMLVPYHAMINLALCQLVDVFSKDCIFHLAVEHVRQIRPAYVNESLKTEMCITNIYPTSNQKYCIVESKINVYKGDAVLVMQMNRKSLFPFFSASRKHEDVPERFNAVSPSNELQHIQKNISLHNYAHHKERTEFRENQLIAHATVAHADITQSSLYCNLFKNVHPVHFNKLKYGDKGIAISGGLILPLICNLANEDFEMQFNENIITTQHFNPVRNNDTLSALSYIKHCHQEVHHIKRLEVTTLGLRQVNPEELIGRKIPQELFLNDSLKPKQLEQIVELAFPDLIKKVVVKVKWEVFV